MLSEVGLTPTPILATAFVLLAGLVALRFLNGSVALPKSLPRYRIQKAGDKQVHNGDAALVFPTVLDAVRNAYSKSRSSAVVLEKTRPEVWAETVVIPPAWVEDIKNLPNDVVSFMEDIDERFNNRLVHVTFEDPRNHAAMVNAISVDLTRHISKVMADLDDELNYAFDTLIPPTNDWTPVYPLQTLPQIVALASGRVFVGAPLHRNPEFMKATITFTLDAFAAGDELNNYPRWLRPYVAPFLSKVKVCKQQHVIMRRLLKEHLEERQAMAQRGEELPVDVMSWVIKHSPDESKFDLAHQAHAQLGISLAAIHTTTLTAALALLDLCERPEYIQPLMDEWNATLATEPEGIVSKTSMPKMRKLDSFIKESQRLNPLGPLTFNRLVKTEFTLPDGTKVPPGTHLAVGAQAIAMDDKLWADADKFDGFRFEKLRQNPGHETKHQFATTGPDSMYFGHGKHACPGRFFAANEIKLILAHIIRNYDIKFPDGQGRPAQITMPGGVIPDPTKPIMFRRKQKAN